uniref:Uncharacterized protein n=1 Tax=Promethearchaeum syntrophicum TaxID=2594042 RepID=A0A5B9DGR3_9ARCH|nr:hypothetical protein [Candidatus Prometheoarchaeum syntrophicum]QEE17847.1 hypothetical protein DSAG12_03685 [Candidatus Prometheoarchaeum syntrophicum]
MECNNCEAPKRKIYGPHKKRPNKDLEEADIGNWVMLLRCPKCEKLWVSVPYEPYASFEYLILWDFTKEDWRMIHDLDNASTIHEWHGQSVKDLWSTLPDNERESVLSHRKRSYGRNPIDIPQNNEKIDINSLIKKINYD